MVTFVRQSSGGKERVVNTLFGIWLIALITLPSLGVLMQLWLTTPRQSLLPQALAMSNWTSHQSEKDLGQIGSMDIRAQSVCKNASRLCRTFLKVTKAGVRAG